MKQTRIQWKLEPEKHDYPAAAAYLSLSLEPEMVDEAVTKLQVAPMSEFKAKDIFRASGLSLLGVSNSHVKKNIAQIEKGAAMSPILLLRRSERDSVVVADGYHRLCAVYALDEDALIPCKIG